MNEVNESKQKIRPSDLEAEIRRLQKSGQMPKLEDVLAAVAESREKYAEKIRQAQKQGHPADSLKR